MTERILADRRQTLRALLFAASAVLVPWPAARAATWDLQALMKALAARKSGRAQFTEVKTLALLNAPIESSGLLRFVAPDFLEMRTLKPKPQTIVVQGGQVTLDFDGQPRQFSLADHPEVAALIDGIRATLNGDLAGLQRVYATSLSGNEQLWTLKLVPRLAAARAKVSEIDISGSGATVLNIAIDQTDGDRSLMTLREIRQP